MREMPRPPRLALPLLTASGPFRLKTRASRMSGRPWQRVVASLPQLRSWGEGAAEETAKKTVAAKKRTTDRIWNDGN